METTKKELINKINFGAIVNAYNHRLYTYHYGAKKLPKNRKIKIEGRIFENGAFLEVNLELKLKEITKIMAEKRANLSQLPTKELLHSFRSGRFYYYDYELFYIAGGYTCLIELRKELSKREHVLNKMEGKKLRAYCSKHGVSKETARKRLFGGK